MTSAHRPTWNSVIASGSNPSGTSYSAQTRKVANRDAASFLSLKTRQPGQGLVEERGSRRELREDLEERERKAREERYGTKEAGSSSGAQQQSKQARAKAIQDNPFPEDADEDVPERSEPSDNEDDDDDDEDAEELMRELAKIKAEREEEEEARRAQQSKLDERSRRDEIMRGNPLLEVAPEASEDLSLKRKWDDDTVFKNQARTAPKPKQRFINDAVRSDFHKKFLNKYVWVDGVSH